MEVYKLIDVKYQLKQSVSQEGDKVVRMPEIGLVIGSECSISANCDRVDITGISGRLLKNLCWD